MAGILLSLLILGSSFLVASLTWQVIYNLFFHPLRKVPGPLICRITDKWLTIVDISGYRTLSIHELHKRYGPSVRIAPDELSFSNSEAIKEIYSQHTAFMKAPIYGSMSLPPIGIFSMRRKEDHSERRRLLSPVFAQNSLNESEPRIRAHVEQLLQIVRDGVSKPLDVVRLFKLVSFDIVGDLFLGRNFNGLVAHEPPKFVEDMDKFFILSGIFWNFPIAGAILSRLPVPSLQDFFGASERLVEFSQTAHKEYMSTYGRSSGRKDLLSKIVALKSETGEAPLTDQEMSMEIANLTFAASDTTSMTLTYLFWELAKHSSWQEKVRNELRSRLPNVKAGAATYGELTNLPILEAVIQESLRLHPAAPSSLPRETPQGGKMLNGFFVPQGTVVSTQCYTPQRDPEAFSNPDQFDPERWLEPPSELMKDLFVPYSRGSRACLGKGMAQMELKLITAALIRDLEVKPAPSCTEDCMIMLDHFLTLTKGGMCELIFSPV